VARDNAGDFASESLLSIPPSWIVRRARSRAPLLAGDYIYSNYSFPSAAAAAAAAAHTIGAHAIYVTSEALAMEEAGGARRRAWNSDRADRASECIARVHRAMHASARSRVNWFRALERPIGQQIPSSASPILLPRLHARGGYFINGTDDGWRWLARAFSQRSGIIPPSPPPPRRRRDRQHLDARHAWLRRRSYASGIDNEPRVYESQPPPFLLIKRESLVEIVHPINRTDRGPRAKRTRILLIYPSPPPLSLSLSLCLSFLSRVSGIPSCGDRERGDKSGFVFPKRARECATSMREATPRSHRAPTVGLVGHRITRGTSCSPSRWHVHTTDVPTG